MAHLLIILVLGLWSLMGLPSFIKCQRSQHPLLFNRENNYLKVMKKVIQDQVLTILNLKKKRDTSIIILTLLIPIDTNQCQNLKKKYQRMMRQLNSSKIFVLLHTNIGQRVLMKNWKLWMKTESPSLIRVISLDR